MSDQDSKTHERCFFVLPVTCASGAFFCHSANSAKPAVRCRPRANRSRADKHPAILPYSKYSTLPPMTHPPCSVHQSMPVTGGDTIAKPAIQEKVFAGDRVVHSSFVLIECAFTGAQNSTSVQLITGSFSLRLCLCLARVRWACAR